MRKCVGVTDADSRGNLRWALVDSQLMEAGGQNAGSLPSLLRPRLCRPCAGTCQPSHGATDTRALRGAGAAQRTDHAMSPSSPPEPAATGSCRGSPV